MMTVGIYGAGQMGAAAAVCFRRAGYGVLLWARNSRKHPAIRKTLAELDSFLVKHLGPANSRAAKIELTDDLAAIDDQAGLVMDCIAEDMAEKVKLLRRPRRPKAVFITTTSGLSITEMGRRSGVGRNLAGTHFWNPPHLMPLVEVVRGRDTSEQTMKTVISIIRSIGKIPVRVNQDVPGFIGNRLLHALWREAINLVQRGIATPEDVDRVARLTFGLRLPAVGPLENMDLVGLDLIQTIHKYLLADLADDHRPLPLLTKLVKNDRNFHHWSGAAMKALAARRDRQIVRQLEYLRKTNAL
jgi:3-hydroxybutyryl-CoA dehydrogenase